MAGRAINILNARKCETAKAGEKPVMMSDGGGLYLRIMPTGKKSWIFVWKLAGKRNEKGLGPYPTISLQEARDKAVEHRKTIANGGEPESAAKRKERENAERRAGTTFRSYAESYISKHEPTWRNPKHRQQWRNTLETYVYPVFGDVAIRDVNIDLVEQALRPIWCGDEARGIEKKPETASRVRGRIEVIIDAAKSDKIFQGENPATMRLMKPKLGKLEKNADHHTAMEFAELPAFFSRLKHQAGMGALALQFAILTAARSGEVRLATWSEIDIEKKVWTVPPERMKAKRVHRVPLSDSALDVLRLAQFESSELNRQAPSANPLGLVFPGSLPRRRGPDTGAVISPLSDMTLSAVLRRMKLEHLTVHGFRSTFRDWCGDMTDTPREVAEAALAHVVGDKAEQAYRRGDAFEKRRKLMDDWAAYVVGAKKAEAPVKDVEMVG